MGKLTKPRKKTAAVAEAEQKAKVEEPKPVEEPVAKKKLKGVKRGAEDEGVEAVKKTKKEEPVVEKEESDEEEVEQGSDIDDEEIDDEEMEDEDQDDEEDEEEVDRHTDMMADEGGEVMDTDVEAFPIQEDDKEGIINILTQIFLRNGDVDVPAMTDVIIAQKPSIGSVIGPAEDETDDENMNMVYAMNTVLAVDPTQGDKTPKFVRSFIDFVLERANKQALKETRTHFAEVLATKVGFLINERMINFPTSIVAPSFTSLKGELLGLPKPYKNVLYIQKIRIADKEKEPAPGPSKGEPGKKKKKMGKAEKKRLAAAALADAEVIFDNVEDAALLKVKAGTAHYFDYPVHNDVEAGSKFHIIEKDGKKFRPFRRAVLMDAKRFNAFVDELTSFSG